ncbi:N-acetylglucosamine-6-phosphate deacetylase [Chitinophaga horti]|uniref:N-acetylglucosamine-6-phosphate deacetylase n=1 Tax=Chitinophaga horti TaxID=2920382 RepID=A0ABY6IYP0_9BACT|nr:N-acetylglucosamine-6-phosphate deacetylase [Chitinophaga horti]UYQ92502.1 N-acetylglucosamine-6-phosphate deacetylase [Chitinophaga horti]
MLHAYTNGIIASPTGWLQGHTILTENGKVTALVADGEVKETVHTTDLQGDYIAPAFIDMQIYGGGGELFSMYPSVQSLTTLYGYCKSGGAAYFMATIPTSSTELMLAAMKAVKAYWEQGGQGLLGLHLEGPFFNPVKKGAHIEAYIKVPTAADIDWILEEGKGIVKMMTLAPERCDIQLVKRLMDAGIIISAGHSNATYPEAYAGFEAGIPAATHLYNAMSGFQHREPGMPGAIFDHPKVMASIVVDGVHVNYNAVRISKKILGERLYLITDAVDENLEGDYKYIRRPDRFVTPEGILSGSCLTMLQAVQNCVTHVGIDLHEALRMAAEYPARLLTREVPLGMIAPGYEAAFVVLDRSLALKQLLLPQTIS